MPNLTKQFNNTAVGVTQSVGVNTVAVQVEISERKKWSGLHVSAAVFAGVGAVVPVVQARVIVVTGNVSFSNDGNNNVTGGPIVPRADNLPSNVNRVLLDLDFSDNLDLDFSEPVLIESDEILTACVGLTFTYQNGTVTIGDPSTIRLMLKGHTGDKDNQEFPYRLR